MRLLAACALCACVPQYDPCFAPEMLVSSPRVLAMRADPPEASLDDPRVQVRALVAEETGPASSRPARLTLCVPQGECGLSLDGEVSRGEIRFDVQAPRDLLDASLRADALAGFGGVRLEARLDVQGAPPARKLLLFSRSSAPNQPIEVAGVRATRLGVEVSRAGDFQQPGPQLQLTVGLQFGLLPLLGEGGEEYDVIDLSGRSVRLRERVSYELYSSGALYFGKLPYSVTVGPLVYFGTLDPDAALADEPLGAPPSNGTLDATVFGSGWLWIVARDGRGAVAWASVAVEGVLDPAIFRRGRVFGCL